MFEWFKKLASDAVYQKMKETDAINDILREEINRIRSNNAPRQLFADGTKFYVVPLCIRGSKPLQLKIENANAGTPDAIYGRHSVICEIIYNGCLISRTIFYETGKVLLDDKMGRNIVIPDEVLMIPKFDGFGCLPKL